MTKTYQFICQYKEDEWAISKEVIETDLEDEQLIKLGFTDEKDYIHMFIPHKKMITVLFKERKLAQIYSEAFRYGISAGNEPYEVYNYYLNAFLDKYK